MSSNKLVVGLTGGIGSGKSTVAELFADKGVTVIDTDMLARELTGPDLPAYNAIVGKFGHHLLMENKHINRKKLRKIIFTDSAAKLWLEKLLHSLIREEMKRLVELAESPYVIVVIPLLFENEPNPLITRTLTVDATEEMQLIRTQMRDMHKPEEVEAIMKTQVSREKRLGAADDVIYNDKKLSDLIPQVEKLHEMYLSLVNSNK